MAPAVVIVCNLVVSVFCLVTGGLGKIDNVSGLQRHLTRFILMIAFMLTGMYACATMSATSLHLGSTLLAFFGCALAIVCIWAFLELDLNIVIEASKSSKLMLQLVAIAKSDWTKALGLIMMSCPILLFVVLNFLNQGFRKCTGRAGEGDKATDKFTPAGRMFMTKIEDWNFTSIFLKTILLGELFFTLQVGVAKATYVFLSWLNATLTDTSLVMVCLLVFAIGSTMFLLPPVPGLPVYIFAGILIGEKGRQDEAIGFTGAVLIATGLGLFTKVVACCGQYMIGYFLGKSLKVQQLIGVDKVPTRAIERVLKSRGLNPGKVSVLVGGPDWPTSVTCGIVGVNIPQMIIGTVPVVTLLAPCVLAGACMGRTVPGEDSDWSMMANGFTAAAAVVNMASMAYAVYTVSQTVQVYGDELAKPRPEHEAVAELTRQEQEAVDAYNRTVRWENLDCCMKVVLLLTVVGMVGCNYVFVGLAALCFRPFAVSSDIKADYSENGLRGNVFNIAYTLGYCMMGVFVVAVILHIIFVKVMARRTHANMKSRGSYFRASSLARL
jgi:hypothetical protein